MGRRITTGPTAAALALLRVAIMVVPAHVPWLTIPMYKAEAPFNPH